MPNTLARSAALAVLLAAATAGCSTAPATLVTQPDFHPGGTVTCLMHQTDEPDAAFEGGPGSRPTSQLTFLAYYTAGGRAPFCDGQPPTATDKAWAQLYARLTGNPTNVAALL